MKPNDNFPKMYMHLQKVTELSKFTTRNIFLGDTKPQNKRKQENNGFLWERI